MRLFLEKRAVLLGFLKVLSLEFCVGGRRRPRHSQPSTTLADFPTQPGSLAEKLWPGITPPNFNAPLSVALAVLDNGNLPVKRDCLHTSLKTLTALDPRPLGGVLSGYHFPLARLNPRGCGSSLVPMVYWLDCGNPTKRPKLIPEEVQLLRQLRERDCQVLGGMPRPTAADGLHALGYIAVHSPNSQDLLFTITPAGRAALATLDAGT
jgi:hypothetical protein